MKKLLGILVLGLLWCNVSFAKDFKYKSTVICGPKKVKYVFTKYIKPYYEHEYFYIYYDELNRFELNIASKVLKGDFVIFNDNTEYTSFTKRYYSHLYNQDGKVTSAILNIEFETMYKFQLISEWKKEEHEPTAITYLNFDKKAMTYSVVNEMGSDKSAPKTGVCWIVS